MVVSAVKRKREGVVMGTTKILIVEDEPNMVAGLRDNFEYEGFRVATAMDGVDGLEKALQDSPDLVILDVMMPKMSGLDVCRQLKAKRPSIPLIMLTARGQEVDKVVGLELGADDYVTKPFSIRELIARTKYHVVANPENADAALFATVISIGGSPVIFDAATGRATAVLVTVTIAVRLQDRSSGNLLYRNDNLIFREPYEISTDIPTFFQEEGPALDRLSRDFASRVVATILENL